MDAAYISTLSALTGTVIGAISTFATSWMTQTTQAKAARLNAERERRGDLYGRFMEESAKLFAHAVTEETVDFSQLVNIYALRGRILLQSSDEVARCADGLIQRIEDIYASPTRGTLDIIGMMRKSDLMLSFAKACRRELSAFR